MSDTVRVAGYGTFITHLLKSLNVETMEGKQWYWEVKVVGTHRLEGYNRVTPKRWGYPIIVEDDSESVLLLVVETDRKNLSRMDHVEGAGHTYDRIAFWTEIDGKQKETFLYIPTKRTLNLNVVGEAIANDKHDRWSAKIAEEMLDSPMTIDVLPELFKDACKHLRFWEEIPETLLQKLASNQMARDILARDILMGVDFE